MLFFSRVLKISDQISLRIVTAGNGGHSHGLGIDLARDFYDAVVGDGFAFGRKFYSVPP